MKHVSFDFKPQSHREHGEPQRPLCEPLCLRGSYLFGIKHCINK